MNLRLKPYELHLKTFVCLALFLGATFIGHKAFAADEEGFGDDGATMESGAASSSESSANLGGDEVALVEDQRDVSEPLVEMHYPVDFDQPYKQRRETTAFTFGLSYENFYPQGFTSILDENDQYTDLFGETEIPMIGFDLGYKYNFALGGIFAGIGYGYATLSEKRGDVPRDLTLTKLSAHIGYVMDNVFEEPYIAPYILGGTTQFTIEESAGANSASGNTQTGFFYRVGALIQLNWMEDTTARTGLHDYGLQNTYLDIFMSQYTASVQDDDPNLETDPNFGAGIKLEF